MNNEVESFVGELRQLREENAKLKQSLNARKCAECIRMLDEFVQKGQASSATANSIRNLVNNT
jgi:hypothetical protein